MGFGARRGPAPPVGSVAAVAHLLHEDSLAVFGIALGECQCGGDQQNACNAYHVCLLRRFQKLSRRTIWWTGWRRDRRLAPLGYYVDQVRLAAPGGSDAARDGGREVLRFRNWAFGLEIGRAHV